MVDDVESSTESARVMSDGYLIQFHTPTLFGNEPTTIRLA